jgi:phosphoglycolate phosphatase-like HAD superfamily hydrolase
MLMQPGMICRSLLSKMRIAIKAVLFDIDGTLINCSGAGKNALIRATFETFGSIGRMKMVDFQGKTDPLILKESLGLWGLNGPDDDTNMTTLKMLYFTYLNEYMNTHDAIIMPGIMDLLDRLASHNEVYLGLLTGNFTESARIKLERFGLNRFFNFGAFGDDAPMRDELPPVARRAIRKQFGDDVAYADMVIIGDTVHDIRCARAVGAVSIAVGTGWSSHELLLAEKPDHFFINLADTEAVIKTILNAT